MIHETHTLRIDYTKLGIAHDDVMPTYTTYIPEIYPECQRISERPTVIICPGGGYNHHAQREGEAIALKMNSYGYNAVVLRYSLAPNEYPCALYELATLVSIVRSHVKEWHVQEDAVIIAGFSAGGHVAASLGNLWNDKELSEKLGIANELMKPDAMLLSYPVITSGEFAHKGSFGKLLGTQYDALVDKVSQENLVNEHTPKTFLWHTFADGSVPVENSLLFASALRKNHIPFELHIFPAGSHGLGLATKETDTKDGDKLQPECAVWTDLFATWMENLKN